jgi:hypothetical protein
MSQWAAGKCWCATGSSRRCPKHQAEYCLALIAAMRKEARP